MDDQAAVRIWPAAVASTPLMCGAGLACRDRLQCSRAQAVRCGWSGRRPSAIAIIRCRNPLLAVRRQLVGERLESAPDDRVVERRQGRRRVRARRRRTRCRDHVEDLVEHVGSDAAAVVDAGGHDAGHRAPHRQGEAPGQSTRREHVKNAETGASGHRCHRRPQGRARPAGRPGCRARSTSVAARRRRPAIDAAAGAHELDGSPASALRIATPLGLRIGVSFLTDLLMISPRRPIARWSRDIDALAVGT